MNRILGVYYKHKLRIIVLRGLIRFRMARKLRLGTQRKNAERKRQKRKTNKVGRPNKAKLVEVRQDPLHIQQVFEKKLLFNN